MKKKLKVAVVGLGNMGRHHVRNYSEIDEAELVAICDINQPIVDQFSKDFNCNGYTNFTAMLESESIDALSITAPTVHHFSIAYEAISNNIHVLIEKPICDSIEKAEQLQTLANEKNVLIMIGHIERFNPAVKKLKELIETNALGEITSLLSRRVGVFPAQIKDANVVIDLAVHDIDIFSYLLNKEPTQIHGNAGSALINDREDYADIMLTFGKQNGLIQVNWITPVRIRTLAITGTKGYAELNYMTQELTLFKSNYFQDKDKYGDDIIKFKDPSKEIIQVEKKEPLAEEIRHFLQCINNQKQPLINAKTGIQALSTALAVMDLIKQQKNQIPS
jgi:UDP-N-acetylglucosamine 3-dehydrogenase